MFPPPPQHQQQQQSQPPPPQQGGFGRPNFPPPPGGGGGFGAPPPQQAGFRATSGGSAPGGFMPPPPMQQQQQPGIEQVQRGMRGMSLGAPPPPAGGGSQPQPPKAPASFPGVAPPGGGFQQQRAPVATFGAPPGPPGSGGGFRPPPPNAPPGVNVPTPPMQQQHSVPPAAGETHQPQMQMSQPASSPFYSQQPSQQRIDRFTGQQQQQAPPNAIPPPGAKPGAATGATVFQENVDFSIQIPKRLLKFTASHIPQTASLGSQSKIAFGAVLRPLAPTAPGETDVDVVSPGGAGIVRCKRCRTYINAFVTWLESGRRWRCNICGQLNECPSAYFCHLDESGQRRDRLQRPELCKSVVEFIAPSEYMVRPPQTPSYFFVIDVSATSVQCGMLECAAKAIRRCLDDLPGSTRTQIGFITYDNSVHYYALKAGSITPQMMVVADLKELFVPAPDDLLVNLQESRPAVESFLDNLPSMFAKTRVNEACLGPALKAAFTVTKHVGGKMLVFQSVMPTLGDGALKLRENYRIMGTPEEVKMLRPDVTWYKDTAMEFSRAQISVDMFLFPFSYIDCAALVELPKLTAGTLHTYAAFNPTVDGLKFETDLSRTLTQTTAFEAVMRIRCTKGMRISNFYGNFLIRGTDLLALPNCTSDSVFAFDLTHDEQSVTSNVVTIQGALLYTSSEGERRIRVLTQALPISSLLSELISSVDTEAMCNLLSKQAVEMALRTNLDNARTRLQQTCFDIIRAAKDGDRRAGMVAGYGPPSGQQQTDDANKPIPENLQLLPLYTLALIKNVTFRGGTDVHPDERIQAMQNLLNMWVTDGRHYMYPRMFSIHDMDASAGQPFAGPEEEEDEELYAGRNRIVLPKVVNLSVERLSSDGVYLLDNAVDMYMWVGRSTDPVVLSGLFGTDSLDGVDPSQIKLLDSGNDLASRLHSIITSIRDERNIIPKVNIIIEGDAAKEQRFFWHLVEDRASFQGGTHSYLEFMQLVHRSGAAHGPRQGAVPPGGMPPPQQGMPPPGAMPPPQQGMPPPGTMPPPQQGMPPPGAMPPQQGMPPPGAMPPPQQGMPPPGAMPPQQPMGMQPPGAMPPPQQGMPPPGAMPPQQPMGMQPPGAMPPPQQPMGMQPPSSMPRAGMPPPPVALTSAPRSGPPMTMSGSMPPPPESFAPPVTAKATAPPPPTPPGGFAANQMPPPPGQGSYPSSMPPPPGQGSYPPSMPPPPGQGSYSSSVPPPPMQNNGPPSNPQMSTPASGGGGVHGMPAPPPPPKQFGSPTPMTTMPPPPRSNPQQPYGHGSMPPPPPPPQQQYRS